MDSFLWTLCFIVVFLALAIIFYVFASSRLSDVQRPWRRRHSKYRIKSMMSYIDSNTGEFRFAELLKDAGAPLEMMASRAWYCLPRRGEFLEMDYTNFEGTSGEYAVMNSLSWRRIREPLELIFRKRKKVWQNDERNVYRFFWIDGESIEAVGEIYLSYDAIHTVYGLVTIGGK